MTQEKSAEQFDEKAAHDVANLYEIKNVIDYEEVGPRTIVDTFKAGMRWQHAQSAKKIAEFEAENKRLREKLRESFSSIAAENNLGLSELEYMPREELISLIKNRFRFLPMEVK